MSMGMRHQHQSAPPRERVRKIEMVGASDTQGYCVDGAAALDGTAELYAHGWRYDNCERAYPRLLSRALRARAASVQAIAGVGVTRNSFASHPWATGPLPMPALYNRTLQTQYAGPADAWDFGAQRARGDAPCRADSRACGYCA